MKPQFNHMGMRYAATNPPTSAVPGPIEPISPTYVGTGRHGKMTITRVGPKTRERHETMTVQRYTGVAITLHWLIVFLLIGSFSIGLYMVSLKFSPQKLTLYSYHKWIGVTIFFLAILRLGWRLTHRPPELPASMPTWQVAASRASHLLLYLFLFAAPLSGWLYSSSAGVPTVLFGITALQLPDLVGKDRELAQLLKFVHMALNYSLGVLICVHVFAALKHLLLDKDGIMARMLPGKTS